MKTKIVLTLVFAFIIMSSNMVINTYFVRDMGIQSSLACVNETNMSGRVSVEASRKANEWFELCSIGLGICAIGIVWKKEILKGINAIKE